MEKRTFLLFIAMAWLSVNSMAQSYQLEGAPIEYPINIEGLDVPGLIFTEFRVDVAGKMYLELSNTGTEEIDLSDFTIISCHNYSGFATVTDEIFTIRNNTFWYLPLKGKLRAGDSYVVTSVYDNLLDNGVADPDGYPMHNIGMLDVADLLIHQQERTATQFLNKPEWEAFAFDSIANFLFDVDLFNGYLLQYRFENTSIPDSAYLDSTLVDLANLYRSDPTFQGKEPKAIAGKADAVNSYVMARKANVKKGNMDWDNSIGTDADDSEWMTIPAFKSKYNVFTTVGTHGDFNLNYSSKHDDIIIDKGNKKVTLPWEIIRGENIIDYFNAGPGMGWFYTPNGDQSFSTVQDGDQLSFYAAGNELKKVDLIIEVSKPAKNLAVAFSRRQRVESLRDQGSVQISYPEIYRIIQGSTPTSVGYINGVEFAIRKDSLLANLIIPGNALFEFSFVDGKDRVDLKQGDKLVIYSEDFTVQKEYIINMEDYKASDNANLANIQWPDINLDVYGEIWDDENLPGFTSNNQTYFVLLAPDEKTIPALQFTKGNVNATLEIERATDPEGTIDQRTTKVKVTSEDESASKVYQITFEKVTIPVQPFYAEPFMSEIGGALQSASVVEIYNPGTEPIDLRNYMLVRGYAGDNLKTAVEHLWLPDFGHPISYAPHSRYRTHYVPGMRWQGDGATEWSEKPGYLEAEFTTPTSVVQPGQVFAIGTLQDGGWIGGRFEDRIMPGLADNLDICLRGWSQQVPGTELEDSLNMPYNLNPNGDVLRRDEYPMQMMFGTGEHGPNNNSIFLLRIENDSIILGLKPVTDPNDYTIVDRFQKPEGEVEFWAGGDPVGPLKVRRLPHVFEGVTEAGEGIGDDNGRSANNSGWKRDLQEEWNDPNYPPDVYGYNISGALRFGETVGWHVTDRYTGYLSVVNSNVYDVSPYYDGDLFIRGDFSEATVSSVTANIIKSDDGQTLEYSRNGVILNASDAIAAGDILKVTSTNGDNISEYVFENASLSADNVLTVKAGSGLTISNLAISGFSTEATLHSVLENLIVPTGAVMNILNKDNNLISTEVINNKGEKVTVLVSPTISLEVIAENGATEVYTLDFGTGDSDAVLYSLFFDVDQNENTVTGVQKYIAVDALLGMVYANANAGITIKDKAGFERTKGYVSYDDVLVVTSPDKSNSVTYSMNFTKSASGIKKTDAEDQTPQLMLYPNPVKDILQFRGIDAKSVTVYSLSGHMVIRKEIDYNQLDVSVLKEGMYLISISDGKGNYALSKFIKQ